ncbi:hypothetical protein CFC21_022650 [Triticum aestivum]|uniref:Uncharacterized protein n=2 Tax=Triticum aestivum TaxID=4565 RepID=A0A9R1EDE7_WHEAT|nr:uncharacterized protein LOC119367560 [Triticum dicoccoides]XP_044323011.1 uncharacterized protein LOC123044351 [Triticum aestivum]KAF7007742.1 hypothetical protein CFC21_022650 [Triticum aestivum]
MHEMPASQRFLFFLVALLLLVATAAAGGDDHAAGTTEAAAEARPPDAAFDVRARKWWPRVPATEGLVRGSERRVPNSSDPLHNR